MNSYELLEICNNLGYNPSKVYLLSDTLYKFLDGEKVLYLKLMNEKAINIYKLLKHYDAPVLFNINSITTNYKTYYLFKGLNENSVDISKVKNMSNSLSKVHDLTKFHIALKKDDNDKFMLIYKILDAKFSKLEMFIRTLETSNLKGDYTWLYLSRYMIILETKKIMFNLQKKISNNLAEKTDLIYAINKNKCSVNDYVNDTLINYNSASFGFVVSDVAKFYVENDHINVEWYKLIDEWLNKYNDIFYKLYFKFLVLYIYVLNLNTEDMLTYQSANNYIQITNKISKFCKDFKKIK